MKKILVPTDFSACALAAENYAFQLAKKADAELVFIHIINTPVDWSKLSKDQEDFFPDTKKTIVEAKSKLNELVKKAISEHRRLGRLFNDAENPSKSLSLIEEELEQHIRFEERVLFHEIQKTASEEQLITLINIHKDEKFNENIKDPFWI